MRSADANEILAFEPSIAILRRSATESLVNPGRVVVHYVIDHLAPATWHGMAGHALRPYYSRELSPKLWMRVKREAAYLPG